MAESILNGKSILAVDDEPDVLAILEEEIKAACRNCIFDKSTTYERANELINSFTYELVILDIMGVRGFDLLEIAVKKNMRAVMLTAHALSPENLMRAHDMGARAYLPKQKLGEIVPFLEDVLKYDFEPGWKRIYEALRDMFTILWGRDWEKLQKEAGINLPRSWSDG